MKTYRSRVTTLVQWVEFVSELREKKTQQSLAVA